MNRRTFLKLTPVVALGLATQECEIGEKKAKNFGSQKWGKLLAERSDYESGLTAWVDPSGVSLDGARAIINEDAIVQSTKLEGHLLVDFHNDSVVKSPLGNNREYTVHVPANMVQELRAKEPFRLSPYEPAGNWSSIK